VDALIEMSAQFLGRERPSNCVASLILDGARKGKCVIFAPIERPLFLNITRDILWIINKKIGV